MTPTTALESAVAPVVAADGDTLYEVVNGQRVELPPMGAYQTAIASVLLGYLEPFARMQELGRVVLEMLFRINPATDLQRRPDVAFVSYQSWPRKRRVPDTNAWDVIPELAVEIINPGNTANEVLTKLREYFQAGVQVAWVIYPVEEIVHVYKSFTDIQVLQKVQELDGGAVLPGFRLPLSSLFEEETQEETTQPV